MKRFFIEKKELLIFIGVVAIVFVAVITVASLALSDNSQTDQPVVTDPDPKPTDPDPVDPVVENKFELPLTGEYEVVRIFYDSTLEEEELVGAIISYGSYMIESKGISYAKSDNSSFNVNAVFDGKVTSVDETDGLKGITVTIAHESGVVSTYSSLENVTVQVGDQVTVGQTIAKSTTSIRDVAAGVHVHLEVKINNSYINPSLVYGKKISEVASIK